MKTEVKAAEKRVENVNDLDLHRLEISKIVFDKIDRNNEKFRAKYSAENPFKYESVIETMRRRKLEKECQRKMK